MFASTLSWDIEMNFEIKDGVLEKQLDDDAQEKVVIPENVTAIGNGAFSSC